MTPPTPVHILAVEDSPSDVELIQLAFEEFLLPCHLYSCEDGEQALNYLNKAPPYQNATRPDLILLDLNLPKKNGYEILEELRSNPFFEDIPIVVLTTSAEEKDRKRVTSYSNTRYLSKPFRFSDYKYIVQSIKSFWHSTREKQAQTSLD